MVMSVAVGKGMLRARVKTRSHQSKESKTFHKAISKTDGSFVLVGITEPDLTYPNGATLGQVAAWMEFGTHSAAGDEIVPERSFIRATIDHKFRAINRLKDQTLQALMGGRISLHTALSTIGFRIVAMMRDTIVRKMTESNQPLAEATLARKRKLGQPDTPLIATRLLLDHIGFQVHEAEKAAAPSGEGGGHH